MQILVADQVLADWDESLVLRDSDGRYIVEKYPIIRATVMGMRFRGNGIATLSFTVTRKFSSMAAMQQAWAGYFWSLTPQGIGTFNCGYSDSDPDFGVVSCPNCVIERVTFSRPIGLTSEVNYYLAIGGAAAGTLPGVIPTPPGVVNQVISGTLASGATTWSFTYPTPYTTSCGPSVNMICPGGGDSIDLTITSSTLTGCSGTLSAPIPSSPSGYGFTGNVTGS